MTAKTSKSASKPNYTFRASWAALLLGINFLVAAYYFGFLK